jgi:hypothetical protein
MVVYEVLGDSNITRCWKSVASDYERLKGSVVRPVTTLVLMKDCLRTVSQSTKFLLISALSNPISKLNFDGGETILKVELASLLEDIMDAFTQTLNCNANLQVMAINATFTIKLFSMYVIESF